MRLIGVDVETTGLDPEIDEITEIGWAVYDTDNWRKPLAIQSHLLNTEQDIRPEITELTGITNELMKEAAIPASSVLNLLASQVESFGCTYFVAHNAKFDQAFIEKAFATYSVPNKKIPWIDTKKDIPFKRDYPSRSLITLAAEHGFLNPFPHAALFDVVTMMKILSQYKIEEVLTYKNEPVIFIKAMVDYENRDKAKRRGFYWQECEGRSELRSWIKQIKVSQLDKEKESATFPIQVLE